MAETELKMSRLALLTLGLFGAATLVTPQAPAAEPAAKTPDVQKVLDKYQSFRPADKDLAIFQLDWVATLKDARERAAKEECPILLVVVTNSYGNMYTGHC